MKRKVLSVLGAILFCAAGAALLLMASLIGTRCCTGRELLPWFLLALVGATRGCVICIRNED